MAVLRQTNWVGQARIDVPMLRALESAVAGDFDVLSGRILGGRNPLVIQGFNLVTTGISQAEALQMQVADAVLVHYQASEAGSVFQVPATRTPETLSSTNTKVSGSFTPSAVNYVGIDLVRSTDASTTDLVMFINTTTLTETPKQIPLARTLDYVIVISTSDFSSMPNVAPVAKVTTGAANTIVSVQDARNIMWRLGSGGTVPNAANAFSWPAGRKEGSAGDVFAGGDKALTSFKGWADSVMTRLWEVAGGEYWYSATADRNVRMVRSGTAFVSNGEYFEWDGTNLHWRGLRFIFDNSTGNVNEVLDQLTSLTNLTNLADGECIYVDLDRTQNRTGGSGLQPVKTALASLGTGAVPGSRYVIAWRYGTLVYTRDQPFSVGSSLKIATTGAVGTSRLSASDTTSSSAPRVTTCDSGTGVAMAAGLSRGNSGITATDFVLGSGILKIGGGSMDGAVQILTTASADSVFVIGSQNRGANANASLAAWNLDNFITHTTNQAFKTLARNNSTGQDETGVFIESCGAIGIRSVYNDTVPANPAPVAAENVRCKLFVRTNGLASPAKRDQVCVLYFDGQVVVLSESNAY